MKTRDMMLTAVTQGVGKGQGMSGSTEEKRIIKPEEFASCPEWMSCPQQGILCFENL